MNKFEEPKIQNTQEISEEKNEKNIEVEERKPEVEVELKKERESREISQGEKDKEDLARAREKIGNFLGEGKKEDPDWKEVVEKELKTIKSKERADNAVENGDVLKIYGLYENNPEMRKEAIIKIANNKMKKGDYYYAGELLEKEDESLANQAYRKAIDNFEHNLSDAWRACLKVGDTESLKKFAEYSEKTENIEQSEKIYKWMAMDSLKSMAAAKGNQELVDQLAKKFEELEKKHKEAEEAEKFYHGEKHFLIGEGIKKFDQAGKKAWADQLRREACRRFSKNKYRNKGNEKEWSQYLKELGEPVNAFLVKFGLDFTNYQSQ